MNEIKIINGPNINLIGTREKDIYGSHAIQKYFDELQKKHTAIKLNVQYFNAEHEIISALQNSNASQGIILNAGAFTHSSLAIADSVAAITTPVVEVHVSNIYARELFRRTSYIAEHCIGSISGFGLLSYELALISLLNKH